jgi:hypothetical protein
MVRGTYFKKNVYFSSKRRESIVRVGRFHMQPRMQQEEVKEAIVEMGK